MRWSGWSIDRLITLRLSFSAAARVTGVWELIADWCVHYSGFYGLRPSDAEGCGSREAYLSTWRRRRVDFWLGWSWDADRTRIIERNEREQQTSIRVTRFTVISETRVDYKDLGVGISDDRVVYCGFFISFSAFLVSVFVEVCCEAVLRYARYAFIGKKIYRIAGLCFTGEVMDGVVESDMSMAE